MIIGAGSFVLLSVRGSQECMGTMAARRVELFEGEAVGITGCVNLFCARMLVWSSLVKRLCDSSPSSIFKVGRSGVDDS